MLRAKGCPRPHAKNHLAAEPLLCVTAPDALFCTGWSRIRSVTTACVEPVSAYGPMHSLTWQRVASSCVSLRQLPRSLGTRNYKVSRADGSHSAGSNIPESQDAVLHAGAGENHCPLFLHEVTDSREQRDSSYVLSSGAATKVSGISVTFELKGVSELFKTLASLYVPSSSCAPNAHNSGGTDPAGFDVAPGVALPRNKLCVRAWTCSSHWLAAPCSSSVLNAVQAAENLLIVFG